MSISLSSLERDNPPPRRKSCTACIKAKRRCDVGLSACQRCLHRQIECIYQLASGPTCAERPARKRRQQVVKQAGGVALEDAGDLPPLEDLQSPYTPLPAVDIDSRHTPPDIMATDSSTDALLASPGLAAFMMFEDADSLLDSILMTPAAPANKPLEVYRDPIQQMDKATHQLNFGFSEFPPTLPGPPVPFALSHIFRSRLSYAVEELRRAPKLFLETTGTPWMHPLLYRDCMPPAIEDAYSACALFVAKNPMNQAVIMRSISCRLGALVATPLPTDAAAPAILARTQALILYQSMYLLDDKAGQLSSRFVSTPAAKALEEATYALLDKLIQDLAQDQSHTSNISSYSSSYSFSSSPQSSDPMTDDIPDATSAQTIQVRNAIPSTSQTEYLQLYPLAPTQAFWERWMLQESTARTFLAAFFLVQLTRLLTGVDPAPCTARTAIWNCWTLAAKLWQAADAVEFAQTWNETNGKLFIVSPSTMDGVLRDCRVDDVDAFGKMIFTTTLGLEEVRGWLASKGGVL